METQSSWFILDRAGAPMPQADLPERPADAKPTGGDEFTPWFKQEEHIHVEDGAITGMHAHGSLASVQERLAKYLRQEHTLLDHFGGNEDILVSQADEFLAG